ncbi:MAG: nuclease-related domain-containing protein [Gammaproteobacteria bacterium]
MESSFEQLQYFSLQSLYSLQTEIMATFGIVFVLMLLALILLLPMIQIRINEYNNNKILKSLGKFQLKNVAIQISSDETVYIDYLILVPSGIFVLNIMKYNGIIFAGENVEQWTQLLNKKSYKFPNPLRDLEICESAVRSLVENCNIIGHIAFESNCAFPKGKPAKITLLHEMQDELEFLQGNVTNELIQKWSELKNSDFCTSNTKQNELSIVVRGEQKSLRKLAGIFFLASSLLLLLYQISNTVWFAHILIKSLN